MRYLREVEDPSATHGLGQTCWQDIPPSSKQRMIFTAWPAYEVSFENVQIADLERLIVYAPSLVELDIPHRENGQRLSVIVPNELPNYRSLGDTNIVELDKLVQDMFKNDPPRFREYYNESKRFREFLLNEISQDTLNKLNIDLETS